MQERIYTTYANDTDMTFIMKEISENSEIVSLEVVGFYFGTPETEATKEYVNCTKAEY